MKVTRDDVLTAFNLAGDNPGKKMAELLASQTDPALYGKIALLVTRGAPKKLTPDREGEAL